jgi:hypothetical protein
VEITGRLKDQPMFITTRLLLPAVAGLCLVPTARAATLNQDFSTDPFQAGWRIFGDPDLFRWNSGAQHLEVTWDSTQPNSYFFHSLGTSLSRGDDFSLAFDFMLTDVESGNEPGKTGGLELAIGFLNLAVATGTNFMRGAYGGAPSLVEFDYFPAGYYDIGGIIYAVAATTTPTFIATNGFDFAPTLFAPYEVELPTNVLVHVTMMFNANGQTLATKLSTNGVPFLQLANVVLTDTNSSAFTETDDYRVDAISVSSYSSAGDPYDSVLAHGMVENIALTFPLPLDTLTGGFSNGVWQVQFVSRSNWLYTLEGTADFQSWTQVATPVAGTGGTLVLQDSNPAINRFFYRVRATRP